MEFSDTHRARISLELRVKRNGHRVHTHPQSMDMAGVSVIVQQPEHFIPGEAVDVQFSCGVTPTPLNLEIPAKIARVHGDEVVLDFSGHDLGALEQVCHACKACQHSARPSRFRHWIAAAVVLGLLAVAIGWVRVATEYSALSDDGERGAGTQGGSGADSVADSPRPAPIRFAPPSPSERRSNPVETLFKPAVELQTLAADGAPLKRGIATVLNEPPLLIVPIGLLEGAHGAWVALGENRRLGLARVLSADRHGGLALLELEPGLLRGYPLSGEEHGLYLGRDVRIGTAAGMVGASVNAAELQRPDAPFATRVIPLRTDAPLTRAGQPVLDTTEEKVLGVIVEPGDAPLATDTGAITRLILSLNNANPQSLGDFNEAFFQGGQQALWNDARDRVDQQDYEGALPKLETLFDARWQGGEVLKPYLLEVYRALMLSAVANGNESAMTEVLARAQTRLGPQEGVRELRVLALSGYRDPSEAYRRMKDLRRDLGGADIDTDLVRVLVLDAAARMLREQRPGAALDLLGEERRHDPGYAPFAALHGRASLALGDYATALRAFRAAVELSPDYAGELQPLIDEAERWGTTPEQTRVRLRDEGGVLMASVYVNDAASPLTMAIDTGATLTIITPDAAARLGLRNDVGATVNLSTANGRITAPRVTLDKVTLGDAQRYRVEAAISALDGGLDGLLGLSFLGMFEVTVDRVGGQISLRRR